MYNKTTLFAALGVLTLIILAIATFLITKPQQPADSPAPSETTETSSYGTENPLEEKPDLNPVEKTNPFTDIKTNPFE